MHKRPPVKEGFFCAGVITAAHGLRGEVTVKLFIANPQSIFEYGTLFSLDDVPFSVSKAKLTPKGALIHFDGVTNRNEAEKLLKTYLYVSDDYLPTLDENDMLLDQLVGTAVLFESGERVGVIRSHFDNGAHTVIQIKRTELQTKDILIPYTDEYILKSDIDAQVVTVHDDVADFFDL